MSNESRRPERKPKRKSSRSGGSEGAVEDWDETRCPVCMDHPHNAVLLKCESYDKGCRPYMCDTSYRHSNCLDQFRKISLHSYPGPTETGGGDRTEPGLVCPLCRGGVTGWVIVDRARHLMNRKTRSCARDTCDFIGTYRDLRLHAREVHPAVRPSEADPERQRDWRLMERRRDIDDLFTILRSSLGDDRGGAHTLDGGGWLSAFFMIRVFRPGLSSSSRRSRSRRRHWGESYGYVDEEETEESGV